MTPVGYNYNPPPGWEVPADDWAPPLGWAPDPAWPAAPDGWQFWVRETAVAASVTLLSETETATEELQSESFAFPTASPSPEETLRQRVAELEAEVSRLNAGAADDSPVVLDDDLMLQEVGIYRYHHPLENAAEYKDALKASEAEITSMVRARTAVLASDMFTYNNSLAQGKRMTAEFSKLMLRAYNAEADNCVRALRAGNVVTAKKRLEASVTSIARLGVMMEMRINPEYHALRVHELELTADYLMKLQVEKEEARQERELLREERRAEQELATEKARLEKEREHYANALAALETAGDEQGVAEVSDRLRSIDEAIEQNDFRIANIRAGYVYVISNRGALGPNVVKIGLTRRLKPMDRIRELSGASVPFPFDVHAMFFADDAVSVEADLHRAFADRRVNHVNLRREFFFATPAEVRDVLLGQVGNLLEFTEHPEATQFLQSLKYWPDGHHPSEVAKQLATAAQTAEPPSEGRTDRR